MTAERRLAIATEGFRPENPAGANSVVSNFGKVVLEAPNRVVLKPDDQAKLTTAGDDDGCAH